MFELRLVEMGLYLCIFEDGHHDNELDGVEVGSYTYFGDFREVIWQRLEGRDWGSRFPTLMNHVDSDGVWTPTECTVLVTELATISEKMERLPPQPLPDTVQQLMVEYSRAPISLADCFIDVDGTPLLDRLIALANAAADADLAIWFQ
ncbi:MAG: hypothetical protein GY926_09800 [bacterium]|nr:hypothetical protein [bacterium]